MDTETYITQPVPVEAVQITAELAPFIAIWCGGEMKEDYRHKPDCYGVKILVPHTSGSHQASASFKRSYQNGPWEMTGSDWIVKDPWGRFSVYADRLFQMTFLALDKVSDRTELCNLLTDTFMHI